MLDLDLSRVGVAPLPASTVIVGRTDSAGQVEVFCVKRHPKSGFLGGAVVFPGGKVDRGDEDPAWATYRTQLAARSSVLAEHAAGFAIAALRETLEEAAILPVMGDSLDASGARSLRQELAAQVSQGGEPGVAFRRLIEQRQLVLDTARLLPLWRWTTPAAEQRRFETVFYWLELPPHQLGESDLHETTQGFWGTPGALLERWERGDILLAPPTSSSLEVLGELSSLTDVHALASRYALDPICPELVFEGNTTILALPGDVLHSVATPVRGNEDRPTRFVLEAQRFVGRRAPRS